MLLKCQYNVDAHFYVLGGKFQCAVCNMSFKNSGSLTNHRKRRHPDEGQARIVHGKIQRAAIAKAKAISNANLVSKLFLKPFNLTEYQVRRLPHKIYCKKTRLHSSRMRTARLLPVSPSMHCTRGYLPLVQGGGTCLWSGGGVCSGGYLPLVLGCVCPRRYLPLVQGGGVPASGPRGGYLPLVWGGVCSGGYLPLVLGCVCPRGCTCLWSWGVSASGPGGKGVGVYPSIQWGRSPPVDRMTDTREKHNLHKLRLRMATSLRHTKVLSVSWQNI